MGTFINRWGLAALVAGATILALPATSLATFASSNGKIFFNTGAAYPSWAPTTSPGGGGTRGPTPATPHPAEQQVLLRQSEAEQEKGTATLTVKVPGPGLLVLKGKALKKLNANGAASLKAKVTFTPTSGSPRTENKSVTLKKQP
jgi:hypothetical protein